MNELIGSHCEHHIDVEGQHISLFATEVLGSIFQFFFWNRRHSPIQLKLNRFQ